MLKSSLLVLTIGYTIFLAVVSLVSLSGMPDIDIDHGDKILHVGAYAVLTFLWLFYAKHFQLKNKLIIIIALCIIYGIILEVIQGMLTTHRMADGLDVLANGVGVVLAAMVFYISKIGKVKNT